MIFVDASAMARHCERSEAIHLAFGKAGKKDALHRRCAPRNDNAGRSKPIKIDIIPTVLVFDLCILSVMAGLDPLVSGIVFA
jgi:hypothetical protein